MVLVRWSGAALTGLLLSTCAAPRSEREATRTARDGTTETKAAPDDAEWTYRVRTNPDLTELVVSARFSEKTSKELGVARPARAFVRDVEVRRGERWLPVSARGGIWQTSDCSDGCEIRYRFDLARAAEALDDVDLAAWRAKTVVSPPSTWLLRPIVGPSEGKYRFSIDPRSGVELVSGVWPRGDAHEADSRWLPMAPYSAFGHFDVHEIAIGDSRVNVAIAKGDVQIDTERVVGWVRTAARATAAFYDGFPVPTALALVIPTDDRALRGRQLGRGGASVLLTVGERVAPVRFARDWRATHEMIHLAVPDLDRRHLWLSEGLASYVEPIARVRIGNLTEQEFWSDLMNGLPKGLPQAGDRGLDYTPTWGRRYWGGSLFCVRADVELRKRSRNEKSLRDALIGVRRAGGTGAVHWPIERFLETADSATGHTVFRDLYSEMSAKPSPIDLHAFFRELGVSRGEDGGVVFDDSAPLAEIRKKIAHGD